MSIPGIFMQTSKFRRYGYGSLDTAPIAPVFNDVQVSFLTDANGDNWKMMNKWMNKTLNTDTSKGIFGSTETSKGNNLAPYELGYQEDYTTDVIIAVFDDLGNETVTIDLNQSFPSAISDVKLDWGDNGDVARFIVNFSIQDWNLTAPMTTRFQRG